MTEASHSGSRGVPLPKRRFGTTEMEITRVGFGAWAIGGTEWSTAGRALGDETSIGAIRRPIHFCGNRPSSSRSRQCGRTIDTPMSANQTSP